MKNSRENRIETLKQNGVDTSKFYNLNLTLPMGSTIEIKVDGKQLADFDEETENTIKEIMESKYIYNPRVDGRFVAAQTFKMINSDIGWNGMMKRFPYKYQFRVMIDELHRLSVMEEHNDPEFEIMKNFFTKEVVVTTCEHYIKQLKKYVSNAKVRKCKGVPYVKLAKYGNVFHRDLQRNVYGKMEEQIRKINNSANYKMMEVRLRKFVSLMNKIPDDSAKCSAWKDAYKGRGAFMTLNNICKHHGVTLTNYETGEKLNQEESLAYLESLIETNRGAYWKYHELLLVAINENDFDLARSIEAQKQK